MYVGQHCPCRHHLTSSGPKSNSTSAGRIELRFHFHRFHHGDGVAFANLLAFFDMPAQ
ncbi:hypothetical protein [Klebsiella pneumoniae ISC21]|nr:hypothetical protein [Klebsiella pneumoniae ISC21]